MTCAVATREVTHRISGGTSCFQFSCVVDSTISENFTVVVESGLPSDETQTKILNINDCL